MYGYLSKTKQSLALKLMAKQNNQRN